MTTEKQATVSAGADAPATGTRGPESVRIGDRVIHTDWQGVRRLGLVTNVVDPATGLVNLVSFGRDSGDAPAMLEMHVRHKPVEGQRLEGWDWEV